MKTLIFNSDKVSRYLYEDSMPVNIGPTNTIVGTGKDMYIICDANSSTVTLITDVSKPDEWENGKYIYDGEWKNNHPNDGKTYKYKKFTPELDESGHLLPPPTDLGWSVVE